MADPVVCLAGPSGVNQVDVDLTAVCGAPADQPVYVVLRAYPNIQTGSTVPKAQASLTEGSLSCSVNAETGNVAECVTTVRDGVLDQFSATGLHYDLTASWPSSTAAYTYTLQSGEQFGVYAAATFGEIITSGLLLSLIAVLVLKFCYQVAVKK